MHFEILFPMFTEFTKLRVNCLWLLSQHRHSTSGGKTEEFRKKYFGQLPCETLNQLTDLYKVDMEMFEYDDSLYRRLCKT